MFPEAAGSDGSCCFAAFIRASGSFATCRDAIGSFVASRFVSSCSVSCIFAADGIFLIDDALRDIAHCSRAGSRRCGSCLCFACALCGVGPAPDRTARRRRVFELRLSGKCRAATRTAEAVGAVQCRKGFGGAQKQRTEDASPRSRWHRGRTDSMMVFAFYGGLRDRKSVV